MNRLLIILLITASALGLFSTSCIEDSFTTSPSDVLTFSVDTLKMGTVFTDEMTTTHRFTVSNRASKSLSIAGISLSGPGAQYFRLNVDGFSGRDFRDVEIRGKDSIFVFVEATLPPNQSDLPVDIEAKIDFMTNGVGQSVVLTATGQDVERIHELTVTSDMTLDAARPYQVFDSIVVAEGATLTLAPGTRLLFHDTARLIVEGSLVSLGTLEQPVTLAGDRTGNVVGQISFDLMSRQWHGVIFRPTSKSNHLTHTLIHNTDEGVVISGDPESGLRPDLTIINSRLRNSGGLVLDVIHSDIRAIGSEFAEAGEGLVSLRGGSHVFNHCTFANYYLFSYIMGPAIAFSHINDKTDDDSGAPRTEAEITNSIIYGLGSDLSHGDLTNTRIYLRNCLLKSAGSDDDNFINCVWDADPLYYTVRNEYIFDYRLHDESPAIGKGDASLNQPEAATDAYGLQRGPAPNLGAYVYTPEEKEE